MPRPLGLGVHQRGESGFRSGYALGKHHAGVVPGQCDDAVEKIFDADLFPGRQEHGRSRLRPMPLPPGFGADRAHLGQLQFAALDLMEGKMRRHHLGHRGRRHPPVGILRVERAPEERSTM
jgi:hypothetical protein